jgi:DNA polymerase II large subunit
MLSWIFNKSDRRRFHCLKCDIYFSTEQILNKCFVCKGSLKEYKGSRKTDINEGKNGASKRFCSFS